MWSDILTTMNPYDQLMETEKKNAWRESVPELKPSTRWTRFIHKLKNLF